VTFHGRTLVTGYNRLSREDEQFRGRVDVCWPHTRCVQKIRVAIGWLLAIIFILMSGRSFAETGELTTEAWGFLLLTPLALALALSPTLPWEVTERNESEWDDEEEETEGSDVPDPSESGFDVPVL